MSAGGRSGRIAWERFGRVLRAVALAFAALAALVTPVLADAPPAAAHATLLFTSPAFDSTVAGAPQRLTLLFDSAVVISGTPVRLTGPDSEEVSLGPVELTQAGTSLEAPVAGAMTDGIYTVDWRVTSGDGEVMAGSYRFAVGQSAAGLSGGAESAATAPWGNALLRWILFAALAVALGEHAGRRLTGAVASQPLPRPWSPLMSLIGFAAALVSALILTGNGSILNALTQPELGPLISTAPGILSLLEVAGFAVAAALSILGRGRWAWLPMIAVVLSEALRAHPGMKDPTVGVPLTALHLAAATLWIGTLVYALRTAWAWRRRPTDARAALLAYARLALVLVATVVLTGLGMALLLVPPDEVLTTEYGRTLVVKTAVVGLVILFALFARGRLRKKAMPRRVRRPALLEAGALVAVLGLSATLTVLPVPGSADASLSFPPPVTGPVAPAAALAGAVGVSVRASEGQLIVELTAPDVGRDEPFGEEDFTLTGNLVPPRGSSSPIEFRRCGIGCFFSPVDWQNGSNRLILSPEAEGWTSAEAGVNIEWPVVPADDLLARAVSATKAMPRLTLYERVTSNTNQGPGEVMVIATTGEAHIGRALFAEGVAPAAVRLPDDGEGNRRIALHYPDEGAVIELVLDQDDRILRETTTAPHHVVSVTLSYG